MPPKQRTIDVLPNPWHALDADGVPQSVVQYPGTRNYVGAKLDHVLSLESDVARFFFTLDKATTVPFTAEIARAVLDGALIAVDAKTAAWCGLTTGFLPPAQALELEKAKALAERQAHLGKDATMQEPPIARTEAAQPDVAQAQAGIQVAHNLVLSTEA